MTNPLWLLPCINFGSALMSLVCLLVPDAQWKITNAICFGLNLGMGLANAATIFDMMRQQWFTKAQGATQC